MIKDYFALAFGNLRHRGLRSWLTILGVFIGIAAVVSLITMGQGLEAAVMGQFGSLSVDKLTIQNKGTGFGPPGSTVVEKLNGHDLAIIEDVQGVDAVLPRLLRVGELEYHEVSGFGYAVDMPEDSKLIEIAYDSLGIEAQEGRLLEASDSGKILLGNNFLENDDFGKDFSVGKKIKLTGMNEMEFEIVGILEKSNSFQMDSVVFIMNSDMEKLYNINDEYDMLVAQVENKDDIEDVAQNIEEALRKDRNEKVGEESFSVETPLQALDSVNTILNIINIIVIGIAAISLFVGGVGIANTMYTSVVERTRDIGIMKAIGAENKDILMIFLIESGLLGLVGGVAGAVIGLLGAQGISSIANSALGTNLFLVTISYPLLIGSVSFSFLVGVLSGILPAMQASKLNVVDALRS